MKKIFANITLWMLLAAVAAGGLSIPGTAAAQEGDESKTLVVVGTAAVRGDNVTGARENAIADGLVTAVALMTGELLGLESFVEHFSKLNQLLFGNAGIDAAAGTAIPRGVRRGIPRSRDPRLWKSLKKRCQPLSTEAGFSSQAS